MRASRGSGGKVRKRAKISSRLTAGLSVLATAAVAALACFEMRTMSRTPPLRRARSSAPVTASLMQPPPPPPAHWTSVHP
ncbi:hypothetical protein Ga0100231_000770 [Opitutaceae bacterium TAV4]|nr:hypothetical protein Ga0100231_000770 [Opitutaceae bacterium TAV4]